MGTWDPNHPSNKKEEPVAKPKYQVKNDRKPYYDADITKQVIRDRKLSQLGI
jgi:hypothetical protein